MTVDNSPEPSLANPTSQQPPLAAAATAAASAQPAAPGKSLGEYVNSGVGATKNAWETTHKVGEYEINPKEFYYKLLPIYMNPKEFWNTGIAQIKDGELILGTATAAIVSSLLSVLLTLSFGMIFTIMYAPFALLGGSVFLLILNAIFKTTDKNFTDFLRVSACLLIPSLLLSSLSFALPLGLMMVGTIVLMAPAIYSNWHMLTTYMKLSTKQVLIVYGVLSLLWIIPLLIFAISTLVMTSAMLIR